MKKPEFDLHAKSYEFQITKALPPGVGDTLKYAKIKTSHLIRQIKRIYPSVANLSLLDAGCGIGLTDQLLKLQFPKLTGFDVSKQCITLAKKRNPELLYEISNNDIFPFEDEKFDLVFAICVLHHIEPIKRGGFIREAYRVLRSGGYFFIYEHNPANPLTRFIVSRCSFDRNASLLYPEECRSLLQNGGFDRVTGGGLIYLPLELLIWQHFEERWLSKIPYGAQYFKAGIKKPRLN